MTHETDDPSTSPSSLLRCSACRAWGHLVEGCARHTTGLNVLLERAQKICEGRRYLVAEMIGVSESGLSRSTRLGKISPRLRARLVALVVAGRLPDALPPARTPGRRPGASTEARSVNVHFGLEATRKEFLRRANAVPDEVQRAKDELLRLTTAAAEATDDGEAQAAADAAKRDLVRIAYEHHVSRFTVLMDAIRSYRSRHRHPPERLDEAPPWKLRCKIAKRDDKLHGELLDFDTWIGGADHRPLVFPTVLAEFLAVEVYVVKRGPVTSRSKKS